jgi:Dolichyl-phosphate-mannose-protein mannosyltransferase
VDTSEPTDRAGTSVTGSASAGAAGPAAARPAATRTGAAGPAVVAGERPRARSRGLRHLALLVVYLAAGIALTWPNATYLTDHHLPAVQDVAGYVWDLWWVAHQIVHLGNPWFTSHMAAPAGIQLGFDTIMPLPGLIMTPVTLIFGPAVSYSLLSIVLPGLLCYVMYRAARLWLAEPGAIAAGALFGLSSMVSWQVWFHLNIALGTLFLPMTLEAAVRLCRRPGLRQGVILGVILGACVLVNQESAVMAGLLAAAVLVPWLVVGPSAARLKALAAGAVVALIVASPQLIAMAQQFAAGGTVVSAHKLASNYNSYGAGLPGLFAPSPQVGHYGLHWLASVYSYRVSNEAIVTFGLLLSVLAVCGVAAAWRRRSTWLFALLWMGGAALSLGSTLVIGRRVFVPLPVTWNGIRVSLLAPYTWLVHVPGLAALREPDRLALLGLVGAAVLAGIAVDWLWRHARPLLAVVAVLAILEAGWTGNPLRGLMPTTLAALDRPIAADHSGSIVLDVPFGLRGGLPLYGSAIAKPALVLATADGHPRAVSYTSWVPKTTSSWFKRHPFYTSLVAVQSGNRVSAAQLAVARRDVHRMDIGWVLVWPHTPAAVIRYLTGTGFVFSYRADQVSVYRPGWR